MTALKIMSSLDYQQTFPELRRQIDQINLNNNMINVIYNKKYMS